jgi:thiosulfate/3-mercaptopyruvate sulfurtransferase
MHSQLGVLASDLSKEQIVTENLLVSTDWLAAHLNDPNLRIVDIRGHVIPASEPPPHYFNHYEDYQKSHVPGAVFIDWVREITDPDDPRHAKVAKPERFAAAMSRAGIGPDTFVVAYDDDTGLFASRLWWMLNYYGHSEVAVLDGGWKKWLAENRPITDAVPAIQPTHFAPRPNPALYRTADQVLGVVKGNHSDKVLLDLRSTEEFAGKYARASRTGHIPGAVNYPRTDLSAPDGTLLPPDQLRKQFAQLGIGGSETEVITYCNGGVSASMGLLAMRVAGLNNGAVYDGSWKEWGNDNSKPIET